MIDKFNLYWPKIKDVALICHILDPRFKLLYVQGREQKRYAKNMLIDCFENYSNRAADRNEPQVSQNQEQPKSLAQRMIAKITNTRSSNEDEIDKYLKQPVIIFTEDADILKWWNENQNEFDVISKIAIDYLSIMASSIPSERCFSAANLTIDKNRANLATDTVQELLCLKSWKKKIK